MTCFAIAYLRHCLIFFYNDYQKQENEFILQHIASVRQIKKSSLALPSPQVEFSYPNNVDLDPEMHPVCLCHHSTLNTQTLTMKTWIQRSMLLTLSLGSASLMSFLTSVSLGDPCVTEMCASAYHFFPLNFLIL